MMCQFVNPVDVTVLPPYMPSVAERADSGLYASNVRALYAEATGLPLSDHSQSDFLALTKVPPPPPRPCGGRRPTTAAYLMCCRPCPPLQKQSESWRARKPPVCCIGDAMSELQLFTMEPGEPEKMQGQSRAQSMCLPEIMTQSWRLSQSSSQIHRDKRRRARQPACRRVWA